LVKFDVLPLGVHVNILDSLHLLQLHLDWIRESLLEQVVLLLRQLDLTFGSSFRQLYSSLLVFEIDALLDHLSGTVLFDNLQLAFDASLLSSNLFLIFFEFLRSHVLPSSQLSVMVSGKLVLLDVMLVFQGLNLCLCLGKPDFVFRDNVIQVVLLGSFVTFDSVLDIFLQNRVLHLSLLHFGFLLFSCDEIGLQILEKTA